MKSNLQKTTSKTAFFLMLFMITGLRVFGQYCSTGFDCYEYISEVSFGDITNTSDCSEGYSDFTAQSTTVQRGEGYQLAVTIESDENDYIYAFVDWNQDGRLNDDGEVYVVAERVSESARYTFFIEVPEDAVLGETRMRVMVDYNNNKPNPCKGGWGEAEDYTLNVADVPACPTPKNIEVDILSSSSAELTWTSTADAFAIKWGASGFDVESDGTLKDGITVTNYQLTDLTEGMVYDVYIRQNCNAAGYSSWAGPFTFTAVLTETITYTGGDISTNLNEALDIDGAVCEPEATLTINVPPGYQLSGLTVRYNMVARRGAWMNEQASMLFSPTLARGEEEVAMGQGNEEGTYEYERSVTFANGATENINFVLRAWRTWGDNESCGTYYNYVQNDSWQLIPTFGRLPSCAAPSELAIDRISRKEVAISWHDAGSDPAEGYEYYYSTDETAPGADAVPSGNTAVSTVNLSGLIAGQTYYFWIRSKCGEDDYSSWGMAVTFSTGDVRYVKEGGSGDGSSWADAAGNLQDMITASSDGDEVWVAAGTYSPGASFEMKNGVTIFGGFPTDGGDLNQRNWREHKTTLTGSANNSIFDIYGVNNTAVLDGFFITGGNASRGGGISSKEASPLLRNLEIRGNRATWGGGIYIDGGAPQIINVAIVNNESEYDGAGVSILNDALDIETVSTFTNVLITGNETGSGYEGGAISNLDAAVLLTNVTIAGNISSGAAVYNQHSKVTVRNSIIQGNSDGLNRIPGMVSYGISEITVMHSLVEAVTTDDTNGNIDGDTDPKFLHANGGDYRLHELSPAIDAGDDQYFLTGTEPDLSGITTDVIGNPRFYEGTTIDLGAFEYNDSQPPLPANIRYVKTFENGGDPTADGLSWETASSDLQSIIDASLAGDEVWVAAGTYESPWYAFSMKDGVAIYGGFPADGGDETQRNWQKHETVLEAFADGDRSVIENYQISGDAILDGFIVQGGETSSGGGMLNEEASPILRNLWIRNNSAAWGGGIFNTIGSSPELIDVIISNNTAAYSGGGIGNGLDSNPTLTRVAIRDNSVTDATISEDDTGGAGIYHQGGSSLKLADVIIEGNSSSNNGGGILLAGESLLLIKNSVIAGNGAQGDGGGIYLAAGSTHAVLINTAIGDNEAEQGGGIYNDGTLILGNTTVGANRASTGGGIYNTQTMSLVVTQNSIISNNHKVGSTDSDDIYLGDGATSVQQYNNSLVTGSGGSGDGWNIHYGVDGGGNLDGNADFLSTDSSSPDFLQLGGCSPAIDAGSNDSYEALDGDLSTDMDAGGNPRLYGSHIDMGAFERQLPSALKITGPDAGTYGIGDYLTMEVAFPSEVVVHGSPYIPITVGAENRKAILESGSESNTLIFQYEVVAGDEDLDGIGIGSAIALNEGEIQYVSGGEYVDLTLCVMTATGILIDGIQPELTAVSIVSNNAMDETLAKSADVVTLSFTASEAIATPVVKIAGQDATVALVDSEGIEWEATYALSETDSEGEIDFHIGYEDLVGNQGLAREVTTDESSVRFDKTAPETPASLTIERGNEELLLSWNANSETDFAFYRLYFGTDKDHLDTYIDMNEIATETYSHKSLHNGTSYYYRVTAIDLAGNESEPSERLSETPKGEQIIEFNELEDKVYGDDPFELTATASSNLPITFVSSNPEIAAIDADGVTIIIHQAGTVEITASQPGNLAFEPAETVQQELVITKATPMITWNDPEAITYGTALGTKQLNAVSDIAGSLTYTPEAGTVLDAGTDQLLKVTFTPEDADNYETVTAEVLINVEKAVAIITSNDVQTHTYDGGIKKVAATLNHDESILTYSAPTNYTDAGSYLVTITAAESPNYTSASKTVKLVIDKSDIKGITFTDKLFTYDGKTKSLAISGKLPEGISVSYVNNSRTDVGSQEVTATIDGGNNYGDLVVMAKLTIIPAEITGFRLENRTFVYDGTAKSLSIEGELPEGTSVSYENNSRTDVGSQEVTATISGSNYETLVLTATLTVTPAERTLDFPALQGKTYGDADFDAGATASSGEVVSYTSSNPAVAEITAAGLIRINGAGEAVITATVPENGNYTGRPQVSRTLVVHKAQQSITFNAPAEVNRDAGSIQLDVSASSGLPVSLTIDDGQVATLDGTMLNIHRLGTINITAAQEGDGNHEAAEPVMVTIRVVDPSADFAVRIHPAVSPNGDGINEFLMIEGIRDYPENRVTVFSRNGTVVWEAEGYDNNQTVFRGTGAGGLSLAPGTYFYIVEVKVDGRWAHKKGYFVMRY